MSDFVLILFLLYCWIFGGSALVWGHTSEKEKKQECQVGFKVNFFENLISNHFYESHWYFKKGCSSHKFSKYLWYEMIFLKLKRKCKNNYVKVGIGKMRTKTLFVLFSKACSILKLMLCNQNLTKLVYQTLFSSSCRACALKLSKLGKNVHQN